MPRRAAILLVMLLAAENANRAETVHAQDGGAQLGAPIAPIAPVAPTTPDAVLPGGVPRIAPSTPEEAAADPSLATAEPGDWLDAGPPRCVRRGTLRGKCDGPRRVPRPFGADEERGCTLGLGSTRVAAQLLIGAPEPRWVAAAQQGSTGTPTGDLLFPVAGGELWRGYGATRRRGRPHNHQGVDLGAPTGTLFRAANDGLVAYSDNGLRGYGNLIIVVHVDASTTFYAHCRAAYVFAGQLVRRGQVLGEVGDTGYARGEHLHFEWHSAGAGRNPLGHFAALPAGMTPTPAQLQDRALALDRSVFHRARHRHHHREPVAPTRPRSRHAP